MGTSCTFTPKYPTTPGNGLESRELYLQGVKLFESLALIYKFTLLFALHFTIFLFNIFTLSGTAPDENTEDMFGVVQLKI